MEDVQGEYIDTCLYDHELTVVESQPWDRLPDESTLWYDRFVLYLLLPPAKRNILETYRQHSLQINSDSELPEKAPGPWYDIAKQWNWQARATSYDDHQRAKLFEDEEKLREDVRQKCVESLLLSLSKAQEGLALKSQDDVRNEPIASLSLTQKNSIRELEHLLAISRQAGNTYNQLNIIINQLPPELQKALAKYLS